MVKGPIATVSAAMVQLYVVNGLSDVTKMIGAVDVRICISPLSESLRKTS